jgi:hypothetical protein
MGRDGLSRPERAAHPPNHRHRLQAREDVYPSFCGGLATIEVAEVGSAAWRAAQEFIGAQGVGKFSVSSAQTGQARPGPPWR